MPYLILLGRVLFGGFFLGAGVDHIRKRKTMASEAAAKGVPAPHIAVVLTGLQLLAGGASVVLGFKPAIGVALIGLFLVPTSFIMHPYWSTTDPEARANDRAQFYKNTALLGANLMLLAIPTPWAWSLARWAG